MANASYRDYGDSCSGVYPDESFEGLLVEHWSNGNLKYRGRFEQERKRIGQHLCFWESGALEELSYWDEGWICGTRIRFREDGSKDEESDFGEHGGRTRAWIDRNYSSDGTLYSIHVYKDDRIVADWLSPEHRAIWKEIGADKIIEDAVRQIYPDE